MKRILLKYLAIIITVLMVTSCEKERIVWDNAESFVAFAGASSQAAEQGGPVGIPVMVVTTSSSATSVTFDFDAESSTAVEGTHFSLVNASKILDISGGGYDTIWIQPIDNEIFTGNLNIVITLLSNTGDYNWGAQDAHTLTIMDNEHPLGDWIGSYSVTATDYWSYFGPETWSVSTSPDPDDPYNLVVLGLGTGYSEWTPITGVVDLEAKTITFSPGSEIGTHSSYSGPLAIFKGDVAGNLYEEPIVGEVRDDGSIYVDVLGIRFVGGLNAGLDYGVYETTWTKTAKKATRAATPRAGEIIKLQH